MAIFPSLTFVRLKSALTHSHTMTPFDTSGKKRLFKTLWEKEKMLVTSIFSFSHHVFYPIKDRNHHICYIYFVVCKYFQFGQAQIFVVWEWVNLTGQEKIVGISVLIMHTVYKQAKRYISFLERQILNFFKYIGPRLGIGPS